mmetsp:Transcript_95444/g.255232  ORF Transcript_95444/g.255232 Transcript_95444/m.255232 type:complete len:211 (-) Transcript_95444:161-793(-)
MGAKQCCAAFPLDASETKEPPHLDGSNAVEPLPESSRFRQILETEERAKGAEATVIQLGEPSPVELPGESKFPTWDEASSHTDKSEQKMVKEHVPVGPIFTVELRRSGSEKFGFVNASRKDGKPVLVITKILPGGQLAKYNSRGASPVRRGAEIISVNGIAEQVQLMREELRKSQEVKLQVQNMDVRPSQESLATLSNGSPMSSPVLGVV